MNVAQKIALEAIEVPEELRELPGWLIWRFEKFEGETKPRKVPYWADGTRRHGEQGGPVDRARLTTFVAARDAAVRKGFDGMGFAPLEGFYCVFLDIDNCVARDGSLPPEIEKIVATTYTEYSPSGKGLRVALRGNLGNRKSNSTPERYGFETFSTSGFVTFTGNILPACEMLCGPDHIADVDDHVRNLCEVRFGSAQPQAAVDPDDFMVGHEPRLGLSIERMQELLDQLDPDMGRDDWIRVGMSLHHECDGDDTGFELWDDWSSGGYSYPGTEGLRTQWDSFERRAGQRRRQVTMATVIKMAKDAKACVGRLDPDVLRQQVQETLAGLPKVEGVRTPVGYSGKFPIYGADDPILHKSSEWFIKGVFPQADLVMLYGASGAGKSFVGLDLVAAISRGVDWQGHRVKKAKVVIIAAEGAGAYGKRIRAYARHHGLLEADIEIGIVNVAPNVIEQFDVEELVKALTAVQADIFVIDTLAQVTPGANENASDDMGRALANIRTISAAVKATALVIHHAGKDASRGARGWSGIRAAADAEIEVSATDTGRLVKITKMKDGDDSGQWGFRLNQVMVGVDNDGDPETSCVVEYIAAPARRAKANEPKGATQKKIMEHALECGAGTPEGAPLEKVVDVCVGLIPFEKTPANGSRKPRDQRRSNVTRSLEKLCDSGFLKTRDDRLYVPSVGPE